LAIPRYDTSVPWGGFLIMMVVGVFLGLVAAYFTVALSLAMISAAWPEAWSLVSGPARRRHLSDAFIGSLGALALLLSVRHLKDVCLGLWPGLMIPPEPPALVIAGTHLPWLGITYGVLRTYPWTLALVAGLLGLLRLRQGRSWWILLLLAGVIALVPQEAKTGGEFLLGFFLVLLRVAVLLLVARWFVSGNLLAAPLFVYLAVAVQTAGPYFGTGSSELTRQGAVAAVLLLLPVLWLVVSGRGKKGGGLPASR
jgi:hypothetical protein